jgi:lincosamide nucleotidyltransferase B/F
VGKTLETSLLLNRLNGIGLSLEQSGHGLALIGLGSVGLERSRLDAYSDLDFFAIVEPGYKQTYLDDLGWLERLCPIAFCFPNTKDGYKLLFTDGIFCEFAVFEPDELQTIPFAPGRIIWKQPHIPAAISQPVKEITGRAEHDQEWLLGEALTNLYVGLAREKRGELLSAMRFIQGYAVDRVVELLENQAASSSVSRDKFAPERRFEQRHPDVAGFLPTWMQGYAHNRESALAILSFLEQRFVINSAIAAAIRGLCAQP